MAVISAQQVASAPSTLATHVLTSFSSGILILRQSLTRSTSSLLVFFSLLAVLASWQGYPQATVPPGFDNYGSIAGPDPLISRAPGRVAYNPGSTTTEADGTDEAMASPRGHVVAWSRACTPSVTVCGFNATGTPQFSHQSRAPPAFVLV